MMQPQRTVRVLTHLASLVTLLVLSAGTLFAQGQDLQWMPDSRSHAWARFGVNSWNRVQVNTDWYDTEGNVKRTNTTITRTRVTKVGLSSFSLCVSATLEVAGQELPSEAKTITRRFGPKVNSSKLVSHEPVKIGGREYPSDVIRFVTDEGDRKQTSTVHYNRDTDPGVLKRVSVVTDPNGKEVMSETTVTVTELGDVRDILGEQKHTWSVTTVFKQGDAMIVTREVKCLDVPGELVSSVTEERDAEGRLVRRSKLELVGYGYGRFRRLFRRRR